MWGGRDKDKPKPKPAPATVKAASKGGGKKEDLTKQTGRSESPGTWVPYEGHSKQQSGGRRGSEPKARKASVEVAHVYEV